MLRFSVYRRELENLLEEVKEYYNTTLNSLKYRITQEEGEMGDYITIEVEDINRSKKIQDKLNQEKRKFESTDNNINIQISEDGVYLLIEDGEIKKKTIYNTIINEGIKSPVMENIDKAFNNRGKSYKIAEYSEEAYRAPNIKVEICENMMKAYVIIEKGGMKNLLTKELIKNRLIEKGVAYGINNDWIEKAVKEGKREEKILVAKGKAKQDGYDAELEYYFERAKNKGKPRVDEEGNVDYKNRNLIEKVKKGQVLVEKIPLTLGKEGIDVKGEIISAKKGKDKKFVPGKNTSLSDDGLVLRADINGLVYEEKGKINVGNIFATDSVGIYSGNIDFDGSVIVEYDVYPGYSIKATGIVEINGNVEKASVEAYEGIKINGNFLGKNKGSLKSKKDIYVKFVDFADISCEGDLFINDGAMNTRISCNGKITAITNSGSIIGGEIVATDGIECFNLGNESLIRTSIRVGDKPEIIEKIGIIKSKIKKQTEKLEATEKNLEYLRKYNKSKNFRDMPQDKKILLRKLPQAKIQLTYDLKDLNKELEKYKEKLEKINEASVTVRGSCYPGTNITIKDKTFKVDQKMSNIKFVYEAGRIRIKQLKNEGAKK